MDLDNGINVFLEIQIEMREIRQMIKDSQQRWAEREDY